MRFFFASLVAALVVASPSLARAEAIAAVPQYSLAVASPVADTNDVRVAIRHAKISNGGSDGLSGEVDPTTFGYNFTFDGSRVKVAKKARVGDGSGKLFAVAGGYVRASVGGTTLPYERFDGPDFTAGGSRSAAIDVGAEPVAFFANEAQLSAVLRPTSGAALFVLVLEGEGQGKATRPFEASPTIEPVGIYPCDDRLLALYQSVDGASRSLRLEELRPDGTRFEPRIDTTIDSLPGESGLTQVSVACDGSRKSVMMLHTGRGIVEAFRDGSAGAAWKTEVRAENAPPFAHTVRGGTSYLLTEQTNGAESTFSAFGAKSFSRTVGSPIFSVGLACSSRYCLAAGRSYSSTALSDAVAAALPIDPGPGTGRLDLEPVVLDDVGASTSDYPRRGCSAAPSRVDGGGVASLLFAAAVVLGLRARRPARRTG